MTSVAAHGLQATLPPGFEARIFVRARVGGERPFPVAHFATFPLPDAVGDFGSGAVTLMGPTDVFAVLFEYGPESLGTALFGRQGMVGGLTADDFRPTVLRRGLGGQCGTQWFFTEASRPFTFYAVLGSQARRASLVPKVNDLLDGISVATAAASGGGGIPWN